jgi:hypothetical protein
LASKNALYCLSETSCRLLLCEQRVSLLKVASVYVLVLEGEYVFRLLLFRSTGFFSNPSGYQPGF